MHDRNTRHRALAGAASAIAVSIALMLPGMGARAAEADRITLGSGVLLKPTDVRGWTLGVDFRAEDPPWLLRQLGDDVFYEIALGQWLDVEGGRGAEDNIEFIEAGTFWRYRPGWLADRWYIDLGAGFAYFSEDSLESDRTLDSRFLFNADLSISRGLGDGGPWRVGVRWRHNSNGGILGSPDRNPGADVILLEVSYAL